MSFKFNHKNKNTPLSSGTMNEGLFDTLGSVAKEIGARVSAYAHEQQRSARESRIRHLRTLESELLIPQYSKHLGMSSTKIRTILNDYQKERPLAIIPNPLYEPGGRHPETIRNPNFDSHLAEFRERENLKNLIKGLHRSIPSIKNLHDEIRGGLEDAYKSREEADPVVERPIGATIDGSGIPRDRKIRKIRKSTYLRRYADILKARRT
jgi:hypothetical protein